jgi:hypothetical protein
MITLRIPTKDQYAYVEVELELPDRELSEEVGVVKRIYDGYIQTFQSENKYSESKFNEMVSKVLDSDLCEWQITTEQYEDLTDSQKVVYQSMKKLKKRLAIEE